MFFVSLQDYRFWKSVFNMQISHYPRHSMSLVGYFFWDFVTLLGSFLCDFVGVFLLGGIHSGIGIGLGVAIDNGTRRR